MIITMQSESAAEEFDSEPNASALPCLFWRSVLASRAVQLLKRHNQRLRIRAGRLRFVTEFFADTLSIW